MVCDQDAPQDTRAYRLCLSLGFLKAPSKVENHGYLGGRERTHRLVMAYCNGYTIRSIVVKVVAS
jgi:hypothetical protein